MNKLTKKGQDKKMVEAMGVEPMSALHQAPSTTCLAFDFTYLPPEGTVQRKVGFVILAKLPTKESCLKFYLVDTNQSN